jgi:hypothetical protein
MAYKDKHQQFYRGRTKVYNKDIYPAFKQDGDKGTDPNEYKGNKADEQKTPPVMLHYIFPTAFKGILGKCVFFIK